MIPVDFERLVPDYIKSFHSYLPSKPDSLLREYFSCGEIIRFNNNENALGPSESAIKAIQGFNPLRNAIYPSGDAYFLREALANYFSKEMDRFLAGNGATELISFVIKAFCSSGDNIITADRTFSVYEWVTEFSGYQVKLVPLEKDAFDDESILNAVDRNTKIIFLCNPNNPTGSYWNRRKLCSFLNRLNGRAIVVVDEAYCEFVEEEDFPNAMDLVEEYSNVVVFRTFSKMFALAALRIGYLYTNRVLADIIRKTAVCYSVNAIAQIAAAAALKDASTQIARTNLMVKESRNYMILELKKRKVEYISGTGNYIMVKVPINDTKFYRLLMRDGIMIRTMTAFRFPGYIRITLRPLDDMRKCLEAFDKACSVC